MDNKNIEILKLKDNLLIIQDKISIFDKKDDYVRNNYLVDFYNTIMKIDNLNNNLKFINELKDKFHFYTLEEIQEYFKSMGFTKKDFVEIENNYNLEQLDSQETPELLRKIEFTKIQNEINRLSHDLNEKYFIFEKNKVSEITNKKLIEIIKHIVKLI